MKKIFLTIFLSTIFFNFSFATDASNQLITKIKNIKSMSANFNQTLINNQSHMNISSKGYMSLKKPVYFKWVTTYPNSQTIVSNGKKLWIYDEDLEQVIIKNISNNLSQTPYLILLSKNVNTINKIFNVNEISDNNFILTPKEDDVIKSISIKFSSENKLESLGITTNVGQFTQIKFSNIKLNNSNIKINDFNFKIPKGSDVINEIK